MNLKTEGSLVDNRDKKLIICGMIPDYPDLAKFDQVWGINSIYDRIKTRIDRIYYFDNHELIAENFAEKVNELGCEVVTRWPDKDIPKSVAYPLDDIVAHFGLCNFTCSVAYAIAQAVYEGYRDITLAGMYHVDDSYEYMHAKPCVDMWCGIAVGRGVALRIHGKSFILRAYRWESPVYGYETNETRWLHIHTMAGAFKACTEYPLLPVLAAPPDGVELPEAVNRESVRKCYERMECEQIKVEHDSQTIDGCAAGPG